MFQRALNYIPGSYKLWYHFLKEARTFVYKFIPSITDEESLNKLGIAVEDKLNQHDDA